MNKNGAVRDVICSLFSGDLQRREEVQSRRFCWFLLLLKGFMQGTPTHSNQKFRWRNCYGLESIWRYGTDRLAFVSTKINKIRSTKTWLDDNDMATMEWPSRSSDLNPMKNLWFETVKDLQSVISRVWSEVDKNAIVPLFIGGTSIIVQILATISGHDDENKCIIFGMLLCQVPFLKALSTFYFVIVDMDRLRRSPSIDRFFHRRQSFTRPPVRNINSPKLTAEEADALTSPFLPYRTRYTYAFSKSYNADLPDSWEVPNLVTNQLEIASPCNESFLLHSSKTLPKQSFDNPSNDEAMAAGMSRGINNANSGISSLNVIRRKQNEREIYGLRSRLVMGELTDTDSEDDSTESVNFVIDPLVTKPLGTTPRPPRVTLKRNLAQEYTSMQKRNTIWQYYVVNGQHSAINGFTVSEVTEKVGSYASNVLDNEWVNVVKKWAYSLWLKFKDVLFSFYANLSNRISIILSYWSRIGSAKEMHVLTPENLNPHGRKAVEPNLIVDNAKHSSNDMASPVQCPGPVDQEKLVQEISAKVSGEMDTKMRTLEKSYHKIIEEINNKRTNVEIDQTQLETLIRDAIYQYDADKTGLFDYALESAGASIISTRCSESYNTHSRLEKIWNIPLWYSSYGPRTVIQRNSKTLFPGECWSFKSGIGYLTIDLSHAINISSVSYEHIGPDQAPDGNRSSAPQLFKLWAYKSENDLSTRVLLGTFKYNLDSHPLQFFLIKLVLNL
uniref:SUN domain-containing protein n=1 Tax=Heterorhabditis bacteriophora TaxID=37862 RepID=A0A1I7X915_HETBA